MVGGEVTQNATGPYRHGAAKILDLAPPTAPSLHNYCDNVDVHAPSCVPRQLRHSLCGLIHSPTLPRAGISQNALLALAQNSQIIGRKDEYPRAILHIMVLKWIPSPWNDYPLAVIHILKLKFSPRGRMTVSVHFEFLLKVATNFSLLYACAF